ncbi:MAG: VPLPA-CTERM sorting domain-containing protein [Pseudomonadota bacterium]
MRAFLSTPILATALLATDVWAAPLNYSFTILRDIPDGNGANTLAPTINNAGTVAFQSFVTINNKTQSFIRTVETDGTVGAGSNPASFFNLQQPIINDAGQFLTTITNSSTGAINVVRINADKSTTTLATIGFAPPGQEPTTDFKELNFLAFNNNGEAAGVARTHDDTFQIVRLASDGSGATVIAEESSDLFNFTRPAINDDGLVAFKAQTPNESALPILGVYTGTGTGTIDLALTLDGGGNSGEGPTINNNGEIFANQPLKLFRSGPSGDPNDVIVLDEVPDAVNSPQFGSPNFNNFGQIAYTKGSELFIDEQRVLGLGDAIDDGVVTFIPGTPGPIILKSRDAFNDLGQAVFEVEYAFVDENGAQRTGELMVRADPEGSTVETALLPFASTPEGENDVALNIFNGLGVLAPIFVDPIVATGFTYTQGVGGENFASLLIPDALPLGDDEFTVEFDIGGTLFSETLFAGQTLDFTGFDPLGISMFSILDVDIAEAVDPTDPFVVGLTFVNGGFSSTLSIDAITVDTDATVVPLPASAFLLLAGLAGLGFAGRRRRT